MPEQKTVNDPIAAYDRLWSKWELPNTLLGGRDAMIAAGTKYLPREEAETAKNYKSRLERTFLFNGYRKAVNGVSGKILTKPIQLAGGDQWESFTGNVDMDGTSIDVFASWMLNAGIGYGLSHFWIDWPDASSEESLAEQNERGFRPYWVFVNPIDVIGWRTEKVGGRQVLSEVRIREVEQVEDGDYDVREEPRVRVLRRDSWELYGPADKQHKQWELREQGDRQINGAAPDSIGWFTLYTNRTGFMEAEPPLHDLAEKNLEHWQSSSDQRNILKIARVPRLFCKGFDKDDVVVWGANSVTKTDSIDADMSFVEHSGAGIASGERDLQAIQEHMAMLSLQPFLTQRSGNETATRNVLETAEAVAPAQQWARNLGATLQAAAETTARWFNLPEPTATVNDELEMPGGSNEEMEIVMQLNAQGVLSDRTVLAEAKRRDILSEDVDLEEELAETGEGDEGVDDATDDGVG